MNTGQSFLSIAALLLLSLTVLKMNNIILANDTVMQDSKLGLLAVSIAASTIEDASKKAFDANTADNGVTDVNLLTPPGSLGPGWWENPKTYNDFDDYNNYKTKITNMPSAEFDLACEVYYVIPSNPNKKVSYCTWHKKLSVTVTSKSMKDTIRMSTIYSYWYFR
jgi:MSHA pilin protein MshD